MSFPTTPILDTFTRANNTTLGCRHPVGCFDFVLDHQGIGRDNAKKMRDEGFVILKEKYPDMKVLVS